MCSCVDLVPATSEALLWEAGKGWWRGSCVFGDGDETWSEKRRDGGGLLAPTLALIITARLV